MKEEPFRFLKRLVRVGNSAGVLIPNVWFKFKKNSKVREVIIEVYSNKIIIKPHNK